MSFLVVAYRLGRRGRVSSLLVLSRSLRTLEHDRASLSHGECPSARHQGSCALLLYRDVERSHPLARSLMPFRFLFLRSFGSRSKLSFAQRSFILVVNTSLR